VKNLASSSTLSSMPLYLPHVAAPHCCPWATRGAIEVSPSPISCCTAEELEVIVLEDAAAEGELTKVGEGNAAP
jgi:hypothetical protein